MGLVLDDMTSAERLARGIESGTGVLIVEVYENEPAAVADLQRGDVILTMNGEPVISERQALLISASTPPGQDVEVTGIRDGERFTTTVTAGERPAEPR